ncbi:MAG: ATP-binding protein [Bacteroidales bacterium]|nr:ATP-binding protein [Bacteroidales bacterium]
MAHKTIIGKNLIEMLMFNIYSDNRVIFREYVQNASDSIHNAIHQGIISPDEAHITINIEKYASKITIEDNGTGIPRDSVEKVLKDIANSNKNSLSSQAGYFGIGRLSGGGYCKKMQFKTSFKGENCASTLTFDVESIREIINDKNDNREAAEIIDFCTECYNTPEEAEKHYFIVTLEDILPDYSGIILEKKIISDYLKEVAPVSYEVSFKNILNNEIECEENAEIKQFYDGINTIKLSVNETNDLRKPYSKKVQTKSGKDPVERIRFVKFSDSEFGDLAWGWVAITPFTESINVTEESAVIGIRLRLHNILIGKKDYFDGTSYFKQIRSNNYFIGEIHVINDKIKPTPQRDDLAPSPQTKCLNEKIQNFFRNELEKIYQDANKLKTTLKKFSDGILTFDELKSEYGKKNNNQYKNLLGYKYLLEVYNPKFEEIIEANTPKFTEIGQVTTSSETETSKSTDSTDSMVKEPQTSDNETAVNKDDTAISEDNLIQDNSQPKSENKETENKEQQTNNENTSVTQGSNENNPFEDLVDKIGQDEIEIVKRIFDIMDKNFSDRKKQPICKTTAKIKNVILKELKKKK